MPVGVMVTLRRERMYAFLDRLISISLPRIRDFRGISPKSFDGRGNYTLGVREQLIFPEVDYDSIDQLREWTSPLSPQPTPTKKVVRCLRKWECPSAVIEAG